MIDKWKDDINSRTAPPKLHNLIDEAAKKGKRKNIFMKSALSFGLAFSMFVAAINVSPGFYAFAQGTFLKTFADSVKISKDSAEFALDTKQFQEVDKVVGSFNIKYIAVEGRFVNVIYEKTGSLDTDKLDVAFEEKAQAISLPTQLTDNLWIISLNVFEAIADGDILDIRSNKDTLNVAVDASKFVKTTILEVNKSYPLSKDLEYTIKKIEIGEFATEVEVLYPISIDISRNDMAILNNKGERIKAHKSMGDKERSFIYTIGVGRQTMHKNKELLLGTVTWNDDKTSNGVIDLVNDKITNLNPMLEYLGKNEVEGNKVVEFKMKDIDYGVLNPIMFTDSADGMAWMYNTDEHNVSIYQLFLPEDAAGEIKFTNYWGYYINNEEHKLKLNP